MGEAPAVSAIEGVLPKLVRWLPVVAALVAWIALACVTLDHGCWLFARGRLNWMLDPLYHDLQVVRLGWQTVLAGGDPLADPSNPYNYPRFVLTAAHIGALAIPSALLALGLAALFLTAVVRVVGKRPGFAAFAGAALVLSPPVLLMMERGNLDAVAFALIGLGLPLAAAPDVRPLPRCLGVFALLTAALLKLYPAVLLVIGLLYWRDFRRWWFAAAFLMFAAWTCLSLDEVALVVSKTTRGLEPSYGVALAGSRFYLEHILPGQPATAARAWLALAMRLSMLAYLAGGVTAAVFGFLSRRRFAVGATSPVARFSFLAGALIYGGTFALGANWSYRLVFLLLCVPLLEDAFSQAALKPWTAMCGVGIVIAFFAPFHLPLPLFFVQQAAEWLLAWCLLAGAAGIIVTRPTDGEPAKRQTPAAGCSLGTSA